MDECLLLVSLRPVDVDGFQVQYGTHTGDILIKKEGRTCKHFFISRDQVSNKRDYEKVMRDALLDFLKTARTGIGLRKDYVKDYCKGMVTDEIKDAWKDYRSAAKKLETLLGQHPSDYLKKYFT